jgi:5-carboxymethyl-2-hydroxymuconic-semialdehyde dehydrogenase
VAGVAVDTRHWIGGRRVAQARTFTDVSPIDEQPVAEVAAGGAAEVTAAVAAASAAFPGWAAASPDDRAGLLHAIAGGIERRAEDLAQVETRDNGSLLRSHRRGVMPRAVRRCRAVRHRPGGRQLELRLLQRRQEHRLRTGGLAPPWMSRDG